jgi:ABC-type cobalt transport system substrate-binding protein
MAGWEIALIIMAVTFMVVNLVSLVVQVKLLTKYDGVITKSLKLMEKVMDKYEPFIDQLFDDDL